MASQDPELRSHVHQEVVGTPILYLHQSAPTLEKPTKKSVAAAQAPGSKLSSHEETTLKTMKRKHFGETIQEPPRKKKKAKNPHSLSCKKSKKVKQANQQKTDGKRKRKRHKRKGGAAKDMSRRSLKRASKMAPHAARCVAAMTSPSQPIRKDQAIH
ncbi:hypothetical protein E2C01_010643 [Portunus trituberculatus]|uniref:Uncharacterized protein n=1 Tax=Portunus trituberculatus TaxID=210409 RepID=A0A5B7D978_PORTR|nr:hypothetical protein [Portunus trituberculatus]